MPSVQPPPLALGVVADRVARRRSAARAAPRCPRRRPPGRRGRARRRAACAAARLHGAGADEGAELGHLGDHHRDDLERIDLVVGVFARLAVLHHQHAQHLAEALDRHAEEAREHLLAGLGQVAEAAGVRGVAGVDRLGGLGDLPDQPLADPQPREVNGARVEPLGRGELEQVVAPQVDRADLGDQPFGHQPDDAVEPLLAAAGLGQRGAQARQQDAAVDRLAKRASAACKSPSLNWPCPARTHHVVPAPPVPDICGR